MDYDQLVHAALEAEEDVKPDYSYFEYLLKKEKVVGLNDEERWELQDFISRYGYQMFAEDEE